QRDTSGETLDDVVFNGSSFTDILKKVRDLLCSRIKGWPGKREDEWWPYKQDWSKIM
ncbi:hypothetical protein L917_08434, partial [Phytophthora nicotianae]